MSPAIRWLAIQHSVADGQPWAHTCPHCGTAIDEHNAPALLPIARCRACRRRVGPPPGLVEIGVLAAAALIAIAAPPLWVTIAYAWWAMLGLALTFIDVAVRRLPDRLTWSATAGFLLLAAPTAVSGGGSAWLRAVEAAAVVGTALGLSALAPQGWVGRGDVKYGLAIGAAAGWVSWFALYLALLLATSLAALTGIAMLVVRHRAKTVPFGPFLFAGVLLTVAVLRA